jgi:hypothetical protein
MLPVFIAVGVGIAGYSAYGFARGCQVCSTKFTLTQTCSACKKDACKDCTTTLASISYRGHVYRKQVFACSKTCADKLIAEGKPLEAKAAAAEDLDRRAAKVRLVSVNYGGKQKPQQPDWTIESGWFRSHVDAENDLRWKAAENDCATVWHVRSETSTGQEGNYKFRLHRVSGLL